MMKMKWLAGSEGFNNKSGKKCWCQSFHCWLIGTERRPLLPLPPPLELEGVGRSVGEDVGLHPDGVCASLMSPSRENTAY